MTDTGAAGGLAGSNVAATPLSPTTVHWVTDGHVIAPKSRSGLERDLRRRAGRGRIEHLHVALGLTDDAQ